MHVKINLKYFIVDMSSECGSVMALGSLRAPLIHGSSFRALQATYL